MNKWDKSIKNGKLPLTRMEVCGIMYGIEGVAKWSARQLLKPMEGRLLYCLIDIAAT